MKTGDDEDSLDNLLGQAPERGAPEELLSRVMAEAARTRQQDAPGLERLKQALHRDWRLPVFTLIPAAALVVILGVVLIQPPVEEPAGVARPVEAASSAPRESVPEIQELSEREFEVVLVLDTLMESEETEIWAEEPKMYF